MSLPPDDHLDDSELYKVNSGFLDELNRIRRRFNLIDLTPETVPNVSLCTPRFEKKETTCTVHCADASLGKEPTKLPSEVSKLSPGHGQSTIRKPVKFTPVQPNKFTPTEPAPHQEPTRFIPPVLHESKRKARVTFMLTEESEPSRDPAKLVPAASKSTPTHESAAKFTPKEIWTQRHEPDKIIPAAPRATPKPKSSKEPSSKKTRTQSHEPVKFVPVAPSFTPDVSAKFTSKETWPQTHERVKTVPTASIFTPKPESSNEFMSKKTLAKTHEPVKFLSTATSPLTSNSELSKFTPKAEPPGFVPLEQKAEETRKVFLEQHAPTSKRHRPKIVRVVRIQEPTKFPAEPEPSVRMEPEKAQPISSGKSEFTFQLHIKPKDTKSSIVSCSPPKKKRRVKGTATESKRKHSAGRFVDDIRETLNTIRPENETEESSREISSESPTKSLASPSSPVTFDNSVKTRGSTSCSDVSNILSFCNLENVYKKNEDSDSLFSQDSSLLQNSPPLSHLAEKSNSSSTPATQSSQMSRSKTSFIKTIFSRKTSDRLSNSSRSDSSTLDMPRKPYKLFAFPSIVNITKFAGDLAGSSRSRSKKKNKNSPVEISEFDDHTWDRGGLPYRRVVQELAESQVDFNTNRQPLVRFDESFDNLASAYHDRRKQSVDFNFYETSPVKSDESWDKTHLALNPERSRRRKDPPKRKKCMGCCGCGCFSRTSSIFKD